MKAIYYIYISITYKCKQWLPDVLVVVWLLFLGISIWQHAHHSTQPPVYDSLSYFLKAKLFWEAVGQGIPFNPMDVVPARPVGTVLMSYPFGFSDNFTGFYFRSVFLPILCMVIAVYIVAGAAKSKSQAGWTAAIAILFSSLPLFYHFDWNDHTNGPVSWGLVDNFQAGIAAMAVAAAVRSSMTKTQAWLLLSVCLAAFTLFIKPSGLMIMALVALSWLVIVAFEWRCAARLPSPGRSLLIYALKGMAGFLIVYGGAISICVFSKYFSQELFAYAKQALAILAEVGQVSFQDVLLLFHKSSGEALPLWIMAVACGFLYRSTLGNKPMNPLQSTAFSCLINSLVIWILGAWYWLVVQSGGSQIRYFYPFMLMGSVCIIPAAQYGWPHANRIVQRLLLALCIMPALNIAGLLLAGNNPSIVWQKLSGFSVSVGTYQEEARLAYTFLDEIKNTGKNPTLYSFTSGTPAIIFENVSMYEEIIKPDQPVFKVVRPIDWLRGFAVRTNEILTSNYILVSKKKSQDTRDISNVKSFNSFESERNAFETWLSTLDENSGIMVDSESRELRLLRIIDSSELSQAMEEFVSAHTWRPKFGETNKPVWWNSDMLSAYAKNPVVEEINFGSVYKLHALSITSIANRIKIEAWWEELRHENVNIQRFLFLHLLDSSGNILQNTQIALFPYTPLNAKRRWRYSEASFDLPASVASAASLAFGIYQVGGDFLLADKGRTDWDGRRVLIPIKPYPHSSIADTPYERP